MKYLYLLIVAIAFASADGFSQNYRYSYDASGNRVKRQQIDVVKNATIPPEKQNETLTRLGDTQVFPNPVKDFLFINMAEPLIQNANILLYDVNGRIVARQTVTQVNNELDLSAYPPGTYILSIRAGNDEQKAWKIIKK